MDPSLFTRSRIGYSNIYTYFKAKLQEFITSKTDPVIVYRWLICYMIGIPNSHPTNFVIFRKYGLEDTRFSQNIVDRMAKLGVDIEYGGTFGYIVCEVDGLKNVTDRAYEVGYFFRQYDTSWPLRVDYAYYMKSLIPLEKMLHQLEPLPK